MRHSKYVDFGSENGAIAWKGKPVHTSVSESACGTLRQEEDYISVDRNRK